MKMASETQERLVLSDQPWGLGLGITAAALVALGFALARLLTGDVSGAVWPGLVLAMCLAAFVAFVRRTIVFLDRPSGRVVVRVASVFGQTETGAALADVVHVEVETRHARKRKGPDTHRPVLRLKDGAVRPLSQVYISGGGAAELAAQINGWLGRGLTR